MKTTTLKLALLAAGVIASVSSAQANLITNGDFETINGGPAANSYNEGGNTWGKYFLGEVDGWNTLNGQPIEIGYPSTYGVSGVGLGDAVMELDTDGNVVAGTFFSGSAQWYSLSFLAADRVDIPNNASGKFQVKLNGNFVTPIVNPVGTAMTLYTYNIFAQPNNNDLRFIGRGKSDSYGVLIDNVSVVVPEPSTYVAGGLALLPLLFGLRSRLLKK